MHLCLHAAVLWAREQSLWAGVPGTKESWNGIPVFGPCPEQYPVELVITLCAAFSLAPEHLLPQLHFGFLLCARAGWTTW